MGAKTKNERYIDIRRNAERNRTLRASVYCCYSPGNLSNVPGVPSFNNGQTYSLKSARSYLVECKFFPMRSFNKILDNSSLIISKKKKKKICRILSRRRVRINFNRSLGNVSARRFRNVFPSGSLAWKWPGFRRRINARGSVCNVSCENSPADKHASKDLTVTEVVPAGRISRFFRELEFSRHCGTFTFLQSSFFFSGIHCVHSHLFRLKMIQFIVQWIICSLFSLSLSLSLFF